MMFADVEEPSQEEASWALHSPGLAVTLLLALVGFSPILPRAVGVALLAYCAIVGLYRTFLGRP